MEDSLRSLSELSDPLSGPLYGTLLSLPDSVHFSPPWKFPLTQLPLAAPPGLEGVGSARQELGNSTWGNRCLYRLTASNSWGVCSSWKVADMALFSSFSALGKCPHSEFFSAGIKRRGGWGALSLNNVRIK